MTVTKKTLAIFISFVVLMTSTLALFSCTKGENSVKKEGTSLTTVGMTVTDTITTGKNPEENPLENVIYNVAPDIVWATETIENASYTFIMGNSVNAFEFAPIDISEMKYLEFDLYVPSARDVSKITSESQFEITSSGTCDVEEFNWQGGINGILKGQDISDGWNHVKIKLPKMTGVNVHSVDYIRWYWVSPKSVISGCKVANLRFTTEGGIDPPVIEAMAGKGFIVNTVFPTEDVVIAVADVTKEPYNADSTGAKDVTDIINKALSDVSKSGGGTVWMPAGKYLVKGSVNVPSYCTLRGDWQDPDKGTDYGTIIIAVPPKNTTVNKGLFMLGGSAGVNGLTVYYPEQNLEDVRDYPFTFYTTGQGSSYMLSSVVNCTVINGYRGIGACVLENNAHEQLTVDNFKGTFLHTAAEVYNQADVGTWKRVTVNPEYWLNCPFNESRAEESKLRSYMRENTVGLILGDLEWTEFAGLYVDGCKYGIQIVKGHRIEFAGSIFDARITDCSIGLKVDAIDSRWGMTVCNSLIEGSEYSIQNNSGGIVKAANVSLVGETGGKGSIVTEEGKDAAEITLDYNVSYKKPEANIYLYQGGVGGSYDVSAVVQALLDEAGKTGGVVYLPGGFYRLDQPLTVPSGVELRGSAGCPTRDAASSTNGTVILSYYGDGSEFKPSDRALITLSAGAGINGVRIIYPDNGPADKNLKTTYAIRGQGEGVYCVNCSIAAAGYGVDFSGCDRHYIKKLTTCCYYNCITVGGKNGTVEGCLQNGTVLLRMGTKLSSKCNNLISIDNAGSMLFDKITRKNCKYINIKDGEGEKIYNSFAYGTSTLVGNSGGLNAEVISVGGDNIGDTLITQSKGSMTVLGSMRYNGKSYSLTGGTLKLYARITINDKSEKPLE